jgi:hypothetical protein
MSDRIPQRHLVAIVAAATAAVVMQTKDGGRKSRRGTRIRIRIPIIIRPRKTEDPPAPQPEKKETP